ncbi:MAG TPA: hypothetical protein VES68_02380, partial [Candidatus Sulfotelmatobacter sp.]|nr:hypothetical protein [Candidatus Sulfotelmatobacter sp.]
GFALVFSILIIFYMLPAFSGNFVNKLMRIDIPSDYFNLFNYLKNEPDTIRVANLPIQSPWGWVYYNWYDNTKPSYQGAGFLYFGIKQPLLDRDFDRWSPYNESYYREMSYAIYSQNEELLKNVVNKYKIGIIFIDRGVIDPQNQPSIMFYDEAKSLIKKSNLIKDDRVFGKIEVFRLNVNQEKISFLNTNINIKPVTNTTYEDFAYSAYGNYISAQTPGFSSVYYPFRDLIDNQSKLHKDLLKIDSEKITLIPTSKVNNFETNSLSQRINIIPSDIISQKSKDTLDINIYPNTPVFDKTQSSSTLKTLINISGRKNVSLSVNRNEFFNLDSYPQNTPFAVGKILLKTNEDNIISAFDTSSLSSVTGGLLAVNPFFSSCGNEGSPTTGFTKSGVKITGKGDICIIIPYKFLSPLVNGSSQSVLSQLRFNLNSDAQLSSCLLDLTNLNCIHYDDLKRNGNQVSISSVLSYQQIQNSAIKIFIRPQNDIENTFSLDNFGFLYTSSFADSVFLRSDIGNIFIKKPLLSFDKIYLSNNVIYDPGFKITNTGRLKNDCPSSLSKAEKNIVSDEGKESVRYSSTIGSFCDHFSYPNLSHNQGYLIGVTSKNKQGLPLTFCISNYKTQKCDIYSDLSGFKSFDRDVFLLPPINDTGVGYNVNLENIGIKDSPSENLVSSIDIIPIPYDFLLNVKSESKTNNLFNGKVIESTNINPLAFIAKTDGNNTILALNYSFESGFKAYSIGCSNTVSCFVKSFFAPFYATELKNHVLVDNWANGWLTEGNKQVAIIFLPQYFEYFGFLLILFTFAYLFLHLRHKNSQK